MDYMERALSLGGQALGSTSPNPPVGAVIVRDGKIVGEGWTQPPGQQHAEAMAIQQAGHLAVGAILYTTLEPCNHFGRTPPCTDAIIATGIAEVHVATTDPNPHVKGNGLARLGEAGIKTHLGEREDEARQLIEAFTTLITTGVPLVTAKFAMSLDGKIATLSGDSKWITGEEARRYVHELRGASDAIMAGINTVIADNPQLTARDDRGSPHERQPLRVVVDSHGRMPQLARMLSEPGKTLVVVSENADAVRQKLSAVRAEVQAIPAGDGSVNLRELLKALGQREIASVFVEGGGTLLGSLFDAALVDKVVAFVAPVIIGGREAPSPVAGKGIENMADALRLHSVEVKQFGSDVAIIGYCK